MGRWIDGRSLLRRLDGLAVEARQAVKDAVEAAEGLSAELAETRGELAEAYEAMSEHQIAAAGAGEMDGEAAGLAGRVAALLEAHESYLENKLDELEAAASQVSRLESARARRAGVLDKALETYEARVAEVEAGLESDGAYRDMVSALGLAEGVSEHARAKLAVARQDADEKGAPFRADPLFMYLFERGYRTPGYEAGPLTRLLDGWVANLCHYDRSWRNFERLVELPEWLAEHVEKVEAREETAEARLSDYEALALKEAGADGLAEKVDRARAALATLDAEIEAAEAEHGRIAAALDSAERGESGPAIEARDHLAGRLPTLTVPELRVLSSQTRTPEDDAIVDRLVTLRKDEMAIELRLEETAATPGYRRVDLDTIERTRRSFKASRLDSPYVRFEPSLVDETVARLLARRIDPRDAVSRLARAMRRSSPKADPRFGGRSRSRTLGLPDIAVGVGMEILKEIGRSSRRSSGGWGGGSLPRGRRTGLPSAPGTQRSKKKSRGGFRTGGGF